MKSAGSFFAGVLVPEGVDPKDFDPMKAFLDFLTAAAAENSEALKNLPPSQKPPELRFKSVDSIGNLVMKFTQAMQFPVGLFADFQEADGSTNAP